MKYAMAFDSTTFVGDSIREVLKTLVEAVIFVMIVMFLFLQDWRSTMIPAITIPVSLVGTFAFIKLLGFSINTLTLFGIVLATGLVVDDAIVVIENIQRHMGEEHVDSHLAASEAMGEVTGAVIATSLVLVAVFVPVAFFPGTTGLLYQQFSLTIAFSIAISAFNSLTFTPSLSALILRPEKEHEQKNIVFRGIETAIKKGTSFYTASARTAIGLRYVVLVVFFLGLAATYVVFKRVPTGIRTGRRPGLVHGVGARTTRRVAGVHSQRHARGRSRVGQGKGHYRRLHRGGVQLFRGEREPWHGVPQPCRQP